MPYFKTIRGHALEVLRSMSQNQVDLWITSPPYYQILDYGTTAETWVDGWVGELGLEPSPHQYVRHLCEIFNAARDSLKETGSLWVNICDTYNSGISMHHQKVKKYMRQHLSNRLMKKLIKEYPPGVMFGVPELFVTEMAKIGWYRKNTIIWHKPNAKPNPHKIKFTNDFEYFYWFVKHPKRYYFDQPTDIGVKGKPRKKRTVWSINTKPNKLAHCATFPKDLIKIPIEACSPVDGVVGDMFGGVHTTGIVANDLGRNYIGIEVADYEAQPSK